MTTAAATQVPLAVLRRPRSVLVPLHQVARPTRRYRWLVVEMDREVQRREVDYQLQAPTPQPVVWHPVASPVRASAAATSVPAMRVSLGAALRATRRAALVSPLVQPCANPTQAVVS